MSTTPYRAGSAVEDDLRELAGDLATAITKARALNLPTSAYLLRMALAEVSQTLSAEADENGGPAR